MLLSENKRSSLTPISFQNSEFNSSWEIFEEKKVYTHNQKQLTRKDKKNFIPLHILVLFFTKVGEGRELWKYEPIYCEKVFWNQDSHFLFAQVVSLWKMDTDFFSLPWGPSRNISQMAKYPKGGIRMQIVYKLTCKHMSLEIQCCVLMIWANALNSYETEAPPLLSPHSLFVQHCCYKMV